MKKLFIFSFLAFGIISVMLVTFACEGDGVLEEIDWGELIGHYPADPNDAVPGKEYYYTIYDDEGVNESDISYLAGNLPIIISVPHGGNKVPNCTGSPSNNPNGDTNTAPLGYLIKEQIFQDTGGYPHIIFARIHRKKIDLNRDKKSKWEGSTDYERVRTAWYDFHRFIDQAKTIAIQQTANICRNSKCGLGFYIDLHGHPTNPLIIIGFGLTGSQLRNSESYINGKVDDSSLRDLYNRFNLTGGSFVDFIRGENSFGGFLDNHIIDLNLDDNAEPVPSPRKPEPGNTYYGGYYNIYRHGNIYEAFENDFTQISGIQLECCTNVRKNVANRENFSKSVGKALVNYFDVQYDLDLSDLN